MRFDTPMNMDTMLANLAASHQPTPSVSASALLAGLLALFNDLQAGHTFDPGAPVPHAETQVVLVGQSVHLADPILGL